MLTKLRRIGYLVLIGLMLVFIFDNDGVWSVTIRLIGTFEAPAWSMTILLSGIGFLLGFLSHAWLRKRKEAKAAG